MGSNQVGREIPCRAPLGTNRLHPTPTTLGETMRRLILPVAAFSILVLGACGDTDTATSDTSDIVDSSTGGDSEPSTTDLDSDGYSTEDGDCDDENAEVYPGRTEDCNGIDDNCNDQVDEGQPDSDGDGLADCMDVEDCDGADNDGDELVDEGFPDNDGDGDADCISEEICDDIDNDGDGLVDEGFDGDGDGHAECTTDCDDTDENINPDALEVAGDLEDNDCDGMVDEVEWAVGDLVITELMVNPGASSDARGEWIEVKNTTNRELYLNGLVLSSSTDGDSHAIVSEDMLVLSASSILVMGNNGDTSVNGNVTLDYVYSDMSLSNEIDDLTISAGDIVIDVVAWDDGDTMPDPEGASIQLDPFYLSASENDVAEYWCDSVDAWGTGTDLGSPGEENPLCHNSDHDGDGYTSSEGDCDDLDPDAYPNAPEKDSTKDNDCDGDVEHMPTAVATYDAESSTLYLCDALTLIGSESSDPDGDSLTYSWELTSAPSSSTLTTSDIQSATDADPVFYPDVAGTYVFTLTVTDSGAAYSYPDSLVLVVDERLFNTDPVSDAGSTETYSGEIACQAFSYGEYYVCEDCADYDHELDGSGSSDPDGDELTYLWAVLSGDGTLANETTSTPTLTQTGPATEYGETESESVEVELTVTDCMAASNTSTVTVYYECTGT